MHGDIVTPEHQARRTPAVWRTKLAGASNRHSPASAAAASLGATVSKGKGNRQGPALSHRLMRLHRHDLHC